MATNLWDFNQSTTTTAINPSWYVDPYGGKASDVSARLTRSTWEDFKKVYQPIARELMASTSYMNPQNALDDAQGAIQKVNTAFDTSSAMRNATMSSYGIAPTAEQSANQQRLTTLNRSASVVDAANRILKNIADRDRALAIGGLPNSGKSYGLRTETGQE